MRKRGSKNRSSDEVKSTIIQTIVEHRHCDMAAIMMRARINQIVAKRILIELISSGVVISLSPREAGINDERVHAVYAIDGCSNAIIKENPNIICP